MNYKSKLVLISSSFLILIIIACTSSKNPQTTLPSDIAPNNARISGTIINIEDISESTGPCSKQPCIATVNVNNVIGYGSSFKTPIAKGSNIKLKFAFTLSKTSKEVFPKLNYILPGLNIGDKFIGDIEMIGLLQLDNSNKSKFQSRIFNYNKID